MTPGRIAEELDRRFVLLTGGARTVLPRQQTLLASVEWSHELLGPDERAALRRLGAFTGPFPLEAAEAVCGETEESGWAVFDIVSRLVDKSLVVHDPDTGWYRLLETIRLYARDRSREAGELQATRDRHANWWAAWLANHHPDGPSDNDLDAIHHAYPNLRAALQWAATTQPELALEFAGALGIYWYLRGLLGDALALGDLALAAAEGHGPAWARAVGRMAMPRYYANDTRYMTEVVPEACAIAEAGGDLRTPLRCQATRVMDIDDLADFRDLARQAEGCGELWVAGRMHICAAPWASFLAPTDGTIDLDHLAAIADQLDASSFRFAAHFMTAERLADDLRMREAIWRLEAAMTIVDRASPTIGLMAFAALACWSRMCGDLAPLERATSMLRRAPRDWGIVSPYATAVQRLPELLGGLVWDGPEVNMPWFGDGVLWVFTDLLGEENVTSVYHGTREHPGDLARFSRLALSARTAFIHGQFRDAERGAAAVLATPTADRHFWLMIMARCAADAGSHLEAARMLGAVAGIQQRFGLPWLPRLLENARDQSERLCRDALGDTGFETAHAEGFELDLDAAVAYALRARGERKRPSTGWDSLTPTERQVVDQVAAGRSNPEIAEVLLMGRTTVKTHLAHIFTKLDLTNRAELAAEAARRASSTSA